MSPDAAPSSVAFLFPGQASQTVGMGRDLVKRYQEARALFELADDTLGFALSRLCFEGPIEELTETRNAQPAILLHSLAVAAVLRARGAGTPSLVAGHSLGEFSAAAAAGALEPADALRVVRRRGELMWEAGQRQRGTMAAVVGLDREACEAVCAEITSTGRGIEGKAGTSESSRTVRPGGTVVVANLNSPGQIVISGDVDAVEAAAAPLKEAGARRVLPLNVSGAFHSPLMEEVKDEFRAFLADVPLRDANPPVVVNVDARPMSAAEELRDGFVRQLVSPVRWQESVEAMTARGVATFVEVGPGNVLTNLGRRSNRSAEFISTSDVEGVEKVLASAAGEG